MQVLIEQGRPVVLSVAAEDSCILSTRLAVDYLRGKGVRAEPLAVGVTVSSPEMVDRIEAHRGPVSEQVMQGWFKESEKVWNIAIGVPGVPEKENGWNGHLIAIVEGRYLLDMSIDQASRPKRDIHLRPFYYELDDPKFPEGGTQNLLTESRVLLRYFTRPEDKSFLTAGDWRKRQYIAPLIKQLP